MRYLEATNKKIKFAYILADMMRKWHGRVGTNRHKARSVSLDGQPFADGMRRHELIGVDGVLTERELLEACVDYAVKTNAHTYQWMSRLGKYLGLTFAEVEALYRHYDLHPQSEWQARRNRHCRASMERAAQKKLKDR